MNSARFVEDTIAAIATPLGEAGLSVIRVSGPQALDVATTCFRPAGKRGIAPKAAASHTVHYGHIVRGDPPTVVDEVLLTVLRAPRTFTREDVVEIGCHGGLTATRGVLDSLLQAGARIAEPGEFTKRAFLNGRIDLAQAEAVGDVIHARTELALAAANEQLAGKLSRRIDELRTSLMKVLAHVEAYIDFPDEDIPPSTQGQLIRQVESGIEAVGRLLATANDGRVLRRGIRAAILGRPNAGKSSLLNHLLGHERAIVSPVAGTTRDTIEETASIRGIPVVFVDTAGLREAMDPVEREGVRRSREALARADLVLHVVDGSEPLHPVDRECLVECRGRKRILVLNKSDLPRQFEMDPGEELPDTVAVSCTSGAGLGDLSEAIVRSVWKQGVGSEMLEVMINARHQDALRRAGEALERALELLKGDWTLEICAMELRTATAAIGEVVGKTTTEDLLDAIFSQFCIGK